MSDLPNFLRQIQAIEGDRSKLIYNLFDEYVDANKIRYLHDLERAKAKRMFWVGFEIATKMERHKATLETKKDPNYFFTFDKALAVWREVVDEKRYDYFEFKKFCKRIGIT